MRMVQDLSFNGLSQHKFQIYCDRRQLKWFKRFLEDQQTKKEGKNQHSSGLFIFRSARLAWKEHEKQGLPWNRELKLFNLCAAKNVG